MHQTSITVRMIDGLLWLTAFAMLGAVIFASLVTLPINSHTWPDKIMHAASYWGLGIAFLLAAVWAPIRDEGLWRNGSGVVAASLILFGALIEVLQGAVGNRTPDVHDAIANAGGVLLGLACWAGLKLWLTSAGNTT